MTDDTLRALKQKLNDAQKVKYRAELAVIDAAKAIQDYEDAALVKQREAIGFFKNKTDYYGDIRIMCLKGIARVTDDYPVVVFKPNNHNRSYVIAQVLNDEWYDYYINTASTTAVTAFAINGKQLWSKPEQNKLIHEFADDFYAYGKRISIVDISQYGWADIELTEEQIGEAVQKHKDAVREKIEKLQAASAIVELCGKK